MKELLKQKRELAKKTQTLFLSKKIACLLMKFYSEDKDIDLVIVNKDKYSLAIEILQKNGWKKQNNLSKIRERDKDFFSHPKFFYLIHLHQAFSWNTVTYLDSQTVWKRKILKNQLYIPSPEDELLIIAAHSLFENKKIIKEEIHYAKKLLRQKLNFSYCKNHTKNFNWEKGWELFLKNLFQSRSYFSFFDLIKIRLSKFTKDLLGLKIKFITKEILSYFLIDWLWGFPKIIKQKIKKPLIISFSGIDGSGKSFQAKKAYELFLKINQYPSIIHIGSMGSTLLKAPSKKTSAALAYAILIKDISQIWWNYLTKFHYDLLIFDRYIWDSLVKITYRQRLKKFQKQFFWMKKLVPKPNLAFLLLTKPQISYLRDKDHPLDYHFQIANLYSKLGKNSNLNLILINANLSKEKVTHLIKKMLLSLFYKNFQPESNQISP